MQMSRFIFPEEMLNLSKRQSFLTVGHCHPCEKSREPDADLWPGELRSGRMNTAFQANGEAFWHECRLQRRCAGVQVCRCAGVQVHRCAGEQVCRCAGAECLRERAAGGAGSWGEEMP